MALRTQAAATLLRSARLIPSRQALAMTQWRFKSDDASKPTSLAEAVDSGAPEERLSNSPDYGAHIDKATSTFTPVPKRVMDGSEDHDILPAAVLSGAPIELQARTVRIYQPAKPASQSGNWGSHHWRMDWDVLAKGHRWENPLMGWQSSGDFMQGTKIEFKSREDAIAFAEKQGYEYFVQEPNERAFTPKAYANNFLYSPKKLKHIRTK
ncbi:ETC complex I subunit conserved region-domain-containing protein [Hypoxylon sp. FL1284]|nr:ETC complex I subunit conserved region-domain-containing protein [Hypoxylon sp. FL1284]